MKSLNAALDRLYQRRQFGIKLGLAPVQRMCELLGNPEQQYGVIHVAGTNGKGSVSAIIASILQASGLKVGLYTSPHMVRFNERIRVDGVDLSDSELVDALADCEVAAEQVLAEQGHEATFFEITTVLAFECFRRAGVSMAVLETGLGGRLDATNVVTPLVSVITRIAMDHSQHLGDTLAAIAGEKAGIIKEGRPVVIAPQEESARGELQRVADASQAPLTCASDAVSVERIGGDLHGQRVRYSSSIGLSGTALFPLLGDHQLENLGVALAAVEVLFCAIGVPLEAAAVKAGVENVRWRGRCELLSEDPCILADAAHNPDGAKSLVKVLRRNGIRHVGLVLGMCGDKDVMDVVRDLVGVARRVWVVPIANERSIDPEKLLRIVRSYGVDAESSSLAEAMRSAGVWARNEGAPIVIAGSIFLLGEVLATGTNKRA
jgi:dihydrofolate synthase/folylpolyglutamate synthase